MRYFVLHGALLVSLVAFGPFRSFASDLDDLSKLGTGKVAAKNALWVENPVAQRFHSSKEVIVAELEGPAVINMIHFALPQRSIIKQVDYHLNRDLLLEMYWDGEKQPSVQCPLVDFFCDPAGRRERVDTVLVNKRRGFNAYFPMPFHKSAKIKLVYDGPEEPGQTLWSMMPCYSYVMYRQVDRLEENEGYFHAQWRQEALRMGKQDYHAMEAKGSGKFIGWNVTARLPGRRDCPVDMNEKFYIDGEEIPSIEFQGIEDSFGFSWGFPPNENMFPRTGYWPFLKGYAAYRFFINDAVRFHESLRVDIGFGKNEHPTFQERFSKPGNSLQLSSTCYWYQKEPHAPFPPMPAADKRNPAPEQPFWPDKFELADKAKLKQRNVKLLVLCGHPKEELYWMASGFGAEVLQGLSWAGWSPPVFYCRVHEKEVRVKLTIVSARIMWPAVIKYFVKLLKTVCMLQLF